MNLSSYRNQDGHDGGQYSQTLKKLKINRGRDIMKKLIIVYISKIYYLVH